MKLKFSCVAGGVSMDLSAKNTFMPRLARTSSKSLQSATPGEKQNSMFSRSFGSR